MDLLCKAYSNASDDETEPELELELKLKSKPVNHHHLPFRPAKRPKPEYPFPTVDLRKREEAPVPGRYISKRERALSVSVPLAAEPNPDHQDPRFITQPVLGSISDLDIPHYVLSSMQHKPKGITQLSQIPEKLSIALHGHAKAVNAVCWSPTHAHLLASAGMDQTIHIWNVWSRDQKKARVFSFHNAAVKDVKWSKLGLFVLSCGYDCSSRLIDVEKGLETQNFKEDQVVGVIKFNPDNSNLFLSGGSKGRLRLWDVRTGKVVHEYVRGLGPILDVEFINDGKQFVSSSDVSGGNVSENSIIVWDISRQVPLSNQVYAEAYTCPCVRYHPFDPYFVAQSNGNYIAIFSSSPPFKLDKYKRYESHAVSGFPVKCNFSLDGDKLVSGSSDGSMYFYNSRSSVLVKKIKAYEQACVDVVFHPILSNVIASCSWNGDVSVFE
ncbi:WD repeat-containing protein 25-like [Durio zibethinus]|uniref:WD repeat-containing protein 25-like n=1 Tax=Durio zibethinus TaxID=66656 RepID=A0A6P5Y3J6_DURZI|nr:WD repeat-containing protein 25-like [Durio zibethinus]